MTTTLIIIAGVLVLGVAGTFVMSLTAARPGNLGVQDGRLADAPASPNCVSTQTSERSHWIAPISFEGSAQDAMSTMTAVVEEMPGSTIIEREDLYLYAEFRSPLFRFVDDVEFLIEPESGRIHFRSASRVGHSDLGANRNRMEQFRTLFDSRFVSSELPTDAASKQTAVSH
ncbi:MAG: DUF1499 domain-containing protein [Planctomycetaceae bacterium]|nr:DUF1499 domain-containing protein [Planctomycetaceae bacterium]